jgi:DNA (cytosine-5)-methyltransferase 1
MLENVPGLLTRGKELFDELRSGLEAAGYFLTYEVLELADYGVPQFRKRLVLLASADNPIEIPPPTHCDPASGKNQRHWRTVRHAVGSMLQPPLRSEVRSGAVLPPYPWHVARNVAPDVRRRLEHALRSDKGRADLPEELRLACHKRYPNGYFDVYGAMSWDSPSPTITSGCTNASKGRFGHPSFPRPLTAREAAKLQTFPLDYRFEGPGVDSVAVQIGNALPKRFATVIGRAVAAHLADPQRATTTEIQGRRRVT